MLKLKKCPICDGKVRVTNEDNYGYTQDEWYVKCDHCTLLFGFAKQYSKKEVIEKWNNRD